MKLQNIYNVLECEESEKKFISMYGRIHNAPARYRSLLENFEERYGKDRSVLAVSSPGRTEICGNHTDYNHGLVLAGAISLDTIAAAAPRDDSTVRIKSDGYDEIIFDIAGIKPGCAAPATSESLAAGVLWECRQSGYRTGGFDAVISSNVPAGLGLSSSAAFETLIVTIISHLYNDGTIDAFHAARIACVAENKFFGKPCGLMDQLTCAAGGLLFMDFKDLQNPAVESLSCSFGEYRLFLTDTGGSHADLTDDYAAVTAETHRVAEILGKRSLRDVRFPEFQETLPALRAKIGDRALLRAYHFFTENIRVQAARDALQKGDLKTFLQSERASGDSSYRYNQNCYSVTDPSHQGICLALAISERVLGDEGACRVHGGGFAGTIQAFVPSSLSRVYCSELERVFGQGSVHECTIRSSGSVRVF